MDVIEVKQAPLVSGPKIEFMFVSFFPSAKAPRRFLNSRASSPGTCGDVSARERCSGSGYCSILR